MDPIKLNITYLNSDYIHPELHIKLIEFWESCLNLDFIISHPGELFNPFSQILSNWIKRKLYFDKDKNIWIYPYWPEYYCQRGGYNKHDFVAFQLAGYQLKDALERGDIEIEITCGKDKYIPAWPKNKLRNGDLKSKIKAAKRAWQPKQKKIYENCKCRVKCDCRPGFIKICCVCYHKPLMVLKKT